MHVVFLGVYVMVMEKSILGNRKPSLSLESNLKELIHAIPHVKWMAFKMLQSKYF